MCVFFSLCLFWHGMVCDHVWYNNNSVEKSRKIINTLLQWVLDTTTAHLFLLFIFNIEYGIGSTGPWLNPISVFVIAIVVVFDCIYRIICHPRRIHHIHFMSIQLILHAHCIEFITRACIEQNYKRTNFNYTQSHFDRITPHLIFVSVFVRSLNVISFPSINMNKMNHSRDQQNWTFN